MPLTLINLNGGDRYMEKWQVISLNDLANLRRKEASIKSLEEQLEEVRIRSVSVSGVNYEKVQASGRAIHNPADQWMNDIMLKEELEQQLRNVRSEVFRIHKTLESMVAEERLVLEHFYIDRKAQSIDNLVMKLHMEKSSIYRLKDRALENYVLIRYGQSSYH